MVVSSLSKIWTMWRATRGHLRIQDPGFAVRAPHRPDVRKRPDDHLRHDSGDPELSPQSHRQNRDDIQRKTGGRAGSVARLVLSRPELGRGICLSKGKSDGAG